LTATILECQTQLTIALKPISDVSTLATFDYGVEYLFTKGDRQTLEREADAIIALATKSVNGTVCPSCRTENTGAVRFCRVCGMPVPRHDLPPELEVMRMSAGASASHLEMMLGVVLQLLTLAIALPLILLGPRDIVQVGWVLFGLGELFSLLILWQGIHRLNTTVNPATLEQQRPSETSRAIAIEERAALPPQALSVTEGTTELMNREEIPISKPTRNTDPSMKIDI
jgi:hypothetical protein